MSESSNITPEMAERVLEANWKNVIRRVSTGKTLNATELGILKARAACNQECCGLTGGKSISRKTLSA